MEVHEANTREEVRKAISSVSVDLRDWAKHCTARVDAVSARTDKLADTAKAPAGAHASSV